MSLIDLPAQKQILWHKMRSDLISLVPSFEDKDTILCPTCCRPVCFDDLSVEHIIPKQALALDPADARQAVSKNERSGLTLLCQKPLLIKGQRIPGHGCNSWKGKHYDSHLRDLITLKLVNATISTQHQVSLYCAGYLALFRQFGYQITLSFAGQISRSQFFHPNDFFKSVPLNCQMILAGEPRPTFNDEGKSYWSDPFRISIDQSTAIVALRHLIFRVPLSRDPTQPIARSLIYTPSRFKFRPDLRRMFD
ncbi:hypothetical protein [Asticcacaulis endophyticus]|uniref:hypothetical protein n=1 Tax=Asticcacaulis endophyticus TaxID=1395890 RepID=UPI0016790560|nr:hypothetical protein [Asticcacaulis endophyticus]